MQRITTEVAKSPANTPALPVGIIQHILLYLDAHEVIHLQTVQFLVYDNLYPYQSLGFEAVSCYYQQSSILEDFVRRCQPAPTPWAFFMAVDQVPPTDPRSLRTDSTALDLTTDKRGLRIFPEKGIRTILQLGQREMGDHQHGRERIRVI